MQASRLELIPIRLAGRLDGPTDLDVLIRITPPRPEVHILRPPINLGLVIDHSGSMAGRGKMSHAREAAVFAVEQLLPTDRVSVTIFDDTIQTLVPNTLVTDKVSILDQIRGIVPNGTTALHAGWIEGVTQVKRNRIADGLNRVLLLSDGLANVGLTDPNAIASEVRAAQTLGVSTTALGLGDDYCEDLLEAIATAGDGNYYYVEHPQQLADIFQTELQGLMATVGRSVVLGLEPRHGVEFVDLLNDFEQARVDDVPGGAGLMAWHLPNLLIGMPLEVVIRLRVPPLPGVTELFRSRLSWTAPGLTERQVAGRALIVPAVSGAEWEAIPQEPTVLERIARLTAARLKLRAGESMARRDFASTESALRSTRAMLECLPASTEIATEMQDLDALWADYEAGDAAKLSKRAKSQRYRSSRGQDSNPSSPPPAK